MGMYTHTNNTYFCLYSDKKGLHLQQIRKHLTPEKVKCSEEFNVGKLHKQDTYFILELSQEKREGLSMEVSRLSCKRGVDVSMRIHPDHTKVWALPRVATDRTKCQAGSTAAKQLVTIFSFRTTTRTIGSLRNFRQRHCHVSTQTAVTKKSAFHTNCTTCH